MAIEYPWYDVANGEDLQQGDFIEDCPIVVPPAEISKECEVRILNYNVVVMSQSCDLAFKKIDLVLLCPVWPLKDMEKTGSFFNDDKGKEELRRGNVPGYHLLNKCDITGFIRDYHVVDFRNIYSVPLDFLIEFSKKKSERLRLLPPYREHLSQDFARFFMRVGLPVDIPSFIDKKK